MDHVVAPWLLWGVRFFAGLSSEADGADSDEEAGGK